MHIMATTQHVLSTNLDGKRSTLTLHCFCQELSAYTIKRVKLVIKLTCICSRGATALVILVQSSLYWASMYDSSTMTGVNLVVLSVNIYKDKFLKISADILCIIKVNINISHYLNIVLLFIVFRGRHKLCRIYDGV